MRILHKKIFLFTCVFFSLFHVFGEGSKKYTVKIGVFSEKKTKQEILKDLPKPIKKLPMHEKEVTGKYHYSIGTFYNYEAAIPILKLTKPVYPSSYITETTKIVTKISTKTKKKTKKKKIKGKQRKYVLKATEKYIGTPYCFGGKGPNCYDCSGLVSAVYKEAGITLPNGTKAQYKAKNLKKVRKPKPGDLLFFCCTYRKGVSHVGIYKGDGVFIHAPGKGKKVKEGNVYSKYWKGKFLGARTPFKR